MKARVTRFSLEKWIPCFCLSIRLVFHVFDLQESLSVCPLVWERDGDRRERDVAGDCRKRGKGGRRGERLLQCIKEARGKEGEGMTLSPEDWE